MTKETALQAVQAFRDSSSAGVWPKLDKTQLADDMEYRISTPSLVDQLNTPFCGPASITFALLERNPDRYVQLAQTLYETGFVETSSRRERCTDTLLASRVPANMSPADWMVLAALRETENWIFSIDADSGGVPGITTPWEMRGWTREILGLKASYTSTYFWGELDAINRADAVTKLGGVAFLMITAGLLGLPNTPATPAQPDSLVAVPNHWVTYRGNLEKDTGTWWKWDSGHIKFRVYSWGNQWWPVDKDEGPFEDYTWGVVYGES